MTFVINEYNQTDSDDTFTNKVFPLFYNKRKLERYIKKYNIYGQVFLYDDTEYSDFINDDSGYSVEIPEPLEIFDT